MDYGFCAFLLAADVSEQERQNTVRDMATAARVGRFASDAEWARFMRD